MVDSARGPARRAAAAAPAGRWRRGPRAAARRPGAEPLAVAAGARRCAVRRLDWWPPAAADAASTIIGALAGAGAGRSQAGPSGGRGSSPTPGRRCCARRPATIRRSGAGATAARTASSASPRTPTPMRCRSRSATAASTSSPTRAPTAITASRAWRSYFRSTIAHNTVELGGRNQSSEGGPFMWLRHARAREIEVLDDGDVAGWTAEHDGYASLEPSAGTAARSGWTGPRAASTSSTRSTAAATTSGWPSISAPRSRRSSTGPARSCAGLAPPAGRGAARTAAGLRWSLHRGETEPILGWYSPAWGAGFPR